jgi:hypothetical protein
MLHYAVGIDAATRELRIDASHIPMPYAEAATKASHDAQADSKGFLHRLLFKPRGEKIGEAPPPADPPAR